MTGYIWNMKRRNIEGSKLRRPLKRSKISDGLYGSVFLYGKFLTVWALVLIADFIVEFRFEYLWPVWLLFRSTFDSFRYQGLAFSILFVCISLTADIICYMFIPVHWLYFAASTYVWVQYVWHTDRGLCLPTISLWLLCIYIELSLRLRDFKCLPFHFDLCRPFAAHCIGYPVVTLGFGFKTYVSYKLQLRKQKEVQKSNLFYMELLQQALPAEQSSYQEPSSARPAGEETISSTVVTASTLLTDLLGHRKTQTAITDCFSSSGKDTSAGLCCNDGVDSSCCIEDAQNSVNARRLSAVDVNNFRDADLQQNTKVVYKSTVAASSKNCLTASAATKSDNIATATALAKKADSNNAAVPNNRDDVINRLKADLKRAKADLQGSRMTEQELRSQLSTVSTNEKATKLEIEQLRHDNDSLQSKLHNLVTSRQQDKQSLGNLERKLQDERKLRTNVEQQLTAEKKKKADDVAAAVAKSLAAATPPRAECGETCRGRRSELEKDLKQVQWQLKCRDDQLVQLQTEAQALRQYKDNQQDSEMLMSALMAVREKNAHLESSLSAETRLKMDLFSALGEAKRQIEVQHSMLMQKDVQIAELKTKVAEVMALVPSTSFGSMNSSSPPHFSAAFTTNPTPTDSTVTKSNLNPNASDYQPKPASTTI